MKHDSRQFPLYNNSQRMHYFLVQTSPDYILTYFTMILGVNNHFHLAMRVNLLLLKNTHISNILAFNAHFSGDFPMHWHHNLILRHASENSHYAKQRLCFLPIMVRFQVYLFIFTCDKALLIFWLSLTYLFHALIKVKTQTRFMVLFTSRSLLTWGKSLDDSPGISPGICLLSAPN